MSIYMTVYKCICMHEYMYVGYVCMYVLYAYMCAHASMCICMYIYIYIHVCMHVCIHVCICVILKLGFERYRGIVQVGRGNCPGELSGGIVRGEMSVLPAQARKH